MKFYKLFPPVFQESSDMQKNIKKGKTQKPTCTECRRSVFASGVFLCGCLRIPSAEGEYGIDSAPVRWRGCCTGG